MEIYIKKRDGTREPFNADRINRSIERACKGLSDPISMVTQIATETRLTLYDGITTEEMDQATINASVQNIKEDIEYDRVATRLLLKTVYRRVVGEFENKEETLEKMHRDGFIRYVTQGVAEGLLDTRMAEKYNLERMADCLDIERDELFEYAGLSSLLNRYAVKDKEQQPRETPQYFFMRIAMGLAYNEQDPNAWAKKFYDKMSRLEYVAGGSTNIHAGTPRPALSNCFLLEIHDDIEHIAKSVADVIKLSKASGGIGASITKLRAAGSPLSSNNTTSSGPTPFAKIIDTAIRAVQRGGKKKGALCFYMENWHYDFPEFLDWKHNAGDDYLRMRTANTAVFLSDEFMRRVANGSDWYMFDPKETPDLNELYGDRFVKRYTEYALMAESGKLRIFKKVPAREQFRQILVSLQTTSHPWLTWKDAVNLRALNNNTGTIHMSNLCTEICLPQDKDHIAVCNLASINLATHVHNKEINWSKLESSVRFALRQLDNLIDINVLPVKEAEAGDKENRAIGLGVMGFTDTLEKLGIAYDSDFAADFADRIFEFISYMAIDESANLAQERGSYSHFAGSGWSRGKVPIDTLARLERDRGIPLTVMKESRHKGLNWDVLRQKVTKGMRNATLMAVAPNANIGLVAGTTPGIDPRFAQVFSRNKISGKYLDINHNLVLDLKNMGLWEKVRDEIIEAQGDIENISDIPEHIKKIYKTSFTTSPFAFIEVAARAQKWVDQALSRNMYLETRDIDETMKIYQTAWEKGVKTTYYLHMKPRHTAEQSTVHVNKAEKMGKKGFAAAFSRKVENHPTAFGGISKLQPSLLVVSNTDEEEVPLPDEAEPAHVPEEVEEVVSPVRMSHTSSPAPFQRVHIADTDHVAPELSVKESSQKKQDVGQRVGESEMREPSPVAEVAVAKRPVITVEEVLAMSATAGPEDPQDQFICDSCQ
ncbi:MAG: ribonucleoside-diphosphate reductase subunit alpha [bacterium]|nr:ribonucleoside-diphosphate reductase subunit alpha [bacterium]